MFYYCIFSVIYLDVSIVTYTASHAMEWFTMCVPPVFASKSNNDVFAMHKQNEESACDTNCTVTNVTDCI